MQNIIRKKQDLPLVNVAVAVIQREDGYVLMAERPYGKESSGFWEFPGGKFELGESAEQALHREVFEEVGVEIDNIRYIGSQAWPYPGQLMLGYIAEAKSETINVDGIEIAEANWFRYDNLPSILAPPTIMAGRLIKQFIDEAVELYG